MIHKEIPSFLYNLRGNFSLRGYVKYSFAWATFKFVHDHSISIFPVWNYYWVHFLPGYRFNNTHKHVCISTAQGFQSLSFESYSFHVQYWRGYHCSSQFTASSDFATMDMQIGVRTPTAGRILNHLLFLLNRTGFIE